MHYRLAIDTQSSERRTGKEHNSTLCFANYSVQCKQADVDAERLIVSTSLAVSNPVLVVATRADIMVMW